MSDVINNARMRIAQGRASDDELARLMGLTVEELDADTTAPDPWGTQLEEPTSQIGDSRDSAETSGAQ